MVREGLAVACRAEEFVQEICGQPVGRDGGEADVARAAPRDTVAVDGARLLEGAPLAQRAATVDVGLVCTLGAVLARARRRGRGRARGINAQPRDLAGARCVRSREVQAAVGGRERDAAQPAGRVGDLDCLQHGARRGARRAVKGEDLAQRVAAHIDDVGREREAARPRHRAEHRPLQPLPHGVVEAGLGRRVDGEAHLGVLAVVACVDHDTEHAVVARVGDEELARARVELHVRGRARDVTQLEARVPAHLVQSEGYGEGEGEGQGWGKGQGQWSGSVAIIRVRVRGARWRASGPSSPARGRSQSRSARAAGGRRRKPSRRCGTRCRLRGRG
eukprot:scaffold40165_cov60-Phaeocystis_antarctica.AAC.7